jgi:CheY-like chemotaxis protein
MATEKKCVRVLVVDDDRDNADTLGMVAEELGNQVKVTYCATQALDVATAFQPTLILIDLAMPYIDGCGLVSRFRQNPVFAQTTIVAITGRGGEEYRSLALKAGFDSVYLKPITLNTIEAVLASVVLAVVPEHQTPRWPERASFGSRRSPTDEPIHDVMVHEKPVVLVVEDEKAVGMMLDVALRDYGFAVWLAATGREAVELYREHYRCIALVLLDVQMPGTDGPTTLAALQRIHSNVKCCFMSGHTGKYSSEDLLDMGAAHVVAKPFISLDVLARLLWDMIDRCR